MEVNALPEERYAFERVLGEGAQGKVYLAYDRKLEKYWAVKELKVSSGEAKIMLELDHPGLPRITDVIEKDNRQYLLCNRHHNCSENLYYLHQSISFFITPINSLSASFAISYFFI